jgi:hypothetical protein
MPTETLERISINVAREFSRTPGPRTPSHGPYSGQEFLQQVLKPKFEAALKSGARLFVNLDGAAGYPSSFLEEAFGGLAREFPGEVTQQRLEIACNDEPYLVEDVWRYINAARRK